MPSVRAIAMTVGSLAALVLPAGASAATIHLDDDVATTPNCGSQLAPCASLAEAAAVAAAGDVVLVAPGRYSNATVASGVTLEFTDSAATITGADLGGTRLDASGASVTVRGSRLTGATLLATSGSIDARRNWWGTSAGADESSASGSVDASKPLRMVAEGSESILVGGTALLLVRLVDVTGETDAGAGGFAATAEATGAGTLDSPTLPIRNGTAGALVNGTANGTITTTVTLDGEQARVTTRVQTAPVLPATPTGQDAPGSAEAPAVRFVTSIRIVARSLARALDGGIDQAISTNRPASVHTWLLLSDRSARRLHLRAPSDPTHELFIIGRARTRAATGPRMVTVRINDRARTAIARADRRIAVGILTVVRDTNGVSRSLRRRVVLSARVS